MRRVATVICQIKSVCCTLMCNIKNSTPAIKIHIIGVSTTEMGVAMGYDYRSNGRGYRMASCKNNDH